MNKHNEKIERSSTFYSWSLPAIKIFEKSYIYGTNPYGAYKIAMMWYDGVITKTDERQFYFNWSKSEFIKKLVRGFLEMMKTPYFSTRLFEN